VSENEVLQKLRDDEPNRQDLESVNPGCYNYLMNLAQDEIERLLAENKRLRGLLQRWCGCCSQACAGAEACCAEADEKATDVGDASD